jgi:DNA-binding NarL/FixJ family response regulator
MEHWYGIDVIHHFGETVTATIVIVEDHGLMAQTLGLALEAEGFTVKSIDGAESSDLAADVLATAPDLALFDLDLGEGRESLPAIPPLHDAGVPVVLVTGVTDPVRRARAVRAGAVGVVDKGGDFDRLRDAVVTTLERGTLLSRGERDEHLALLRRHETEAARRLEPFEALSPREADVLRDLVHGRSVDEIARERFVAVSTVRSQVQAILRKLGVNSQLAATAMARESGWMASVPRPTPERDDGPLPDRVRGRLGRRDRLDRRGG